MLGLSMSTRSSKVGKEDSCWGRRVQHCWRRTRFSLCGRGARIALACVAAWLLALQQYQYTAVIHRSEYLDGTPTVTSLAKDPLPRSSASYIVKDEDGKSVSTQVSPTPQSRNVPDQLMAHPKDLAIIGAAGNIGSKLLTDLREAGYLVDGFDREPRIPTMTDIARKSSIEFSRNDLKEYKNVLFLGGCSGRASCDKLESADLHQEMVQNLLDLAENMDSSQHLILVSTQSISEGSGYNAHKEDDPVMIGGLDAYSSSMRSRELAFQRLAKTNAKAPQVTILRLCTLIGVSRAQRIDVMIPAFFKSAYSIGVLKVTQGDSVRCFLWLTDLSRAVAKVISPKNRYLIKSFSLYNLSSFTASVMKVAATIASMTGARIDTNESPFPEQIGHSLNRTLFERTFNFTFTGNLANTLEEMEANIPDSITPKGPHQDAPLKVGDGAAYDSIPCPVCGSRHLQQVLDLQDQPLANDFKDTAEEALNATRFPLKLVRCRECNHMHLSHSVDRSGLFSKYLYRSGTSKTLNEYFQWLAEKVHSEMGEPQNGNVLEIACNDGSQLDHFKKLGWSTYGVDPASNLVPIGQENGHTVKVGFWGTAVDFPELPPADKLDAIVAQNVLAHVPRPVEFLKACANAMGEKSRLYIQTSQCNMHQLGQFDTAYHEHISFFTGSSFYKAAMLSGLYLENFETTPIHGTSCLVTFRKASKTLPSDSIGEGLQKRLDVEKAEGMYTDFFYEKYRARSVETRTWVAAQLRRFSEAGYSVGAFGAAAKGMVLLHFMIQESESGFPIDFIVDDEPMKQNKFCSGTSIPVWPTSKLRSLDSTKPLVILVLAWNFWEEISKNIRRELFGQRDSVFVVLPFPSPRLVELKLNDTDKVEMTVLRQPYYPAPIPNPLQASNTERKKVLLLTNFKNQEHLLPYWIRNHAHIFDHAILIDHGSSDRSADVIRKMAPRSWIILNSTDGNVLDNKINGDIYYQTLYGAGQYPAAWEIKLPVTEFLLHPHLRKTLDEEQRLYGDEHIAYKIPTVRVIGQDGKVLSKMKPLPLQSSVCFNRSRKKYRYIEINTLQPNSDRAGGHKFARSIIKNLPNSIGLIMDFNGAPWRDELALTAAAEHHPNTKKKQDRGYTDFVSTLRVSSSRKDNFDLCNSTSSVKSAYFRTFHEATGSICP